MPTPAQFDLPMTVAQAMLYPLWPIEAVEIYLSLSHDKALGLADEVPFAWDIKSPSAEKRELRFWWADVAALAGQKVPAFTETQVYNAIVPSHWGTVTVVSLSNKLKCDAGLIEKLLEAKCLTATTEGRRGPGGSPKVTRASVMAFLKARRMSK